MPETSFDLLVIGAGPGGYVAAIRAAQLGMRVVCVEKASLGGTCLNIGCIPSKALLESSELFVQASTALAQHGVHCGRLNLDITEMMGRKQQIVQKMRRGVAALLRKHQVTLLSGTARFRSPQTVEVYNQTGASLVKATRILIATGSIPAALPQLPVDGVTIVSSTEALAFPEVPRHLVVVGAGAVGLELASVWSRLGAEVVVIELLDRILPGMDREVADHLQRLLQRQGLRFHLRTEVVNAMVQDNRVHLTLNSQTAPGSLDCERVLVAVGRQPHIAGLEVEAIGIALDERQRIVVNEHFETSVAGVYAIGDVIAGPMLAHKAEEEGMAAVEGMAGGACHVHYRAIPSIVYTAPELAAVGWTEEDARAQGLTIRTGTFPFVANGRAHCLGATEGLVKIIGEAHTDRLLGLHILSAQASNLIAEGVLALECAASIEDIARTVHAHPTLPEAIKEAALAAAGRGLHA